MVALLVLYGCRVKPEKPNKETEWKALAARVVRELRARPNFTLEIDLVNTFGHIYFVEKRKTPDFGTPALLKISTAPMLAAAEHAAGIDRLPSVEAMFFWIEWDVTYESKDGIWIFKEIKGETRKHYVAEKFYIKSNWDADELDSDVLKLVKNEKKEVAQ